MNMFSMEEGAEDMMGECAMYPDVESLENFQTGDSAQDGSREPICNLEWTDDIDVINVLHGEWPVTLQVCCTAAMYTMCVVYVYVTGRKQAKLIGFHIC